MKESNQKSERAIESFTLAKVAIVIMFGGIFFHPFLPAIGTLLLVYALWHGDKKE